MVNPSNLLLIGLVWCLQIQRANSQGSELNLCPQHYHSVKTAGKTVCLRYFNKLATWQEAFNTCQEDFATLLQFDRGNTKEEIDLFKSRLSDTEKSSHIWLALRRLNDYFQWVGAAPKMLKSAVDLQAPPWGTKWAPNEPRIWDGCVAFDLSNETMVTYDCATDSKAFICQRNQLKEKLHQVFSCDEASGWLGHDAFSGCVRAGAEPSTWKEANQACRDVSADLILANRPFYSTYFRIVTSSMLEDPLQSWIYRYVDCKDESSVNCTTARRPYLCLTQPKVPDIRVRLIAEFSQRSNIAVWTTNATQTRSPRLRCEVTVDGEQVSIAQTETLQFMWSRNGVYLDQVKIGNINPASWQPTALFPDYQNSTLYVVLGTYQCDVKLPGLVHIYSSDVISIFIQELHMFLYTITMKVDPATEFMDLDPTACEAAQTQRLITSVTDILKSVLPLENPQDDGFDGFRWFIHSARPRMPPTWTGTTERFAIFRIYVGVIVASDPLATVEDTAKKLRKRANNVKANIAVQELERCSDKVVTVGETNYTLQMLARTPEVFSDPSCVTYESVGEKLPSICRLSYTKGPHWDLLNYTSCLSGHSETSCPAGLYKVSEELCIAEFLQEAVSWEQARNKCQSLNSHLLHPTVERTEAWPKEEVPMISWTSMRQNYTVIYDRMNEFEAQDETTANENCISIKLKPHGWRPGSETERKDCSSPLPFTCVRHSLPQSLWDVPWCLNRWLGTHQKSFRNSCFFIHWSQDTTLAAARSACAKMGSQLAILNRPEAVDAIKLTINQMSKTRTFPDHGYWTALDKTPVGLFFWTVSSGKAELAKVSVSNVTGGDSVAFYPVASDRYKTGTSHTKNIGLQSWRAVKGTDKIGFICQKLNVGNVARKTRVHLFITPQQEHDGEYFKDSLTCEGLDVHVNSTVYWYRNGLNVQYMPKTSSEYIDESSTLRETVALFIEGDYWCEIWSFDPYYPVRSKTVTVAAYSGHNLNFVVYFQTTAANQSAVLSLQKRESYKILDYVHVETITKVFRANDLIDFYGVIDAKLLSRKRALNNREVETTLRELQKGISNHAFNGEIRYTAGCFSENTTAKNNQTLTWPYTRIGTTTLPLQLCVTASGSSVTRECMGSYQLGAFWGQVIGSCDGQPGDITNSLYRLSQSNITKDSATKTADDLLHLTKETSQLQPIDITYIAMTMKKIAETGNVNIMTLQHVASTVDHLMDVVDIEKLNEAHATSKSSSSITQSLEKMLNTVDLGSDPSFNLSLPSLYMETQTLNAESARGELVVGIASLQEEAFNSNRVIRVKEDMDLNYTETDAALILPQDFVRKRTKHAGASNSLQLSFIIYKDSRLFIGAQTKMNKIVSRVVAASMTGLPATNLYPPVELLFRPLQPVRSLDNASCVYWDVRMASGNGDWSNAGCWPFTSRNGLVVCHCNHLTNFAVLMDVYGQDERVTGHHKFALDIITYIGCALSILGLSLTILTFFAFKKWRKNNGSKVLCNLAASLLCVLIVFLAGIEQTEYQGLCIVVAVLLHYFVLTSFCWMLIEAVHQYLLFVRVLDTYIPKFVLKSMLFAWGAPLAFVITILAVDVNMYRGGEHYCWMSLDAIYYTFLLPIGIIVFINAIVFILVLKGITCDRQSALRSNQSKRQLAMAQLHASACIFVLLGLTWIFGFLAISSARIAFQYLFCICNSLQGLLIFLFMIVRERNAKELWFLICFRKHGDTSGLSSSTAKKKQSKLEEHNFSENCSASVKLAANNSRFSTNNSRFSTNTVLTT